MPPPRYLDRSYEELTTGRDNIVLYCVCGHWKMFEPVDFTPWPGLSLYGVIARAKCSACGKVGEIPQITVLPRYTGGVRGL